MDIEKLIKNINIKILSRAKNVLVLHCCVRVFFDDFNKTFGLWKVIVQPLYGL